MRRVVLDHVEKVVREFALMKEQKGWELMNYLKGSWVNEVNCFEIIEEEML